MTIPAARCRAGSDEDAKTTFRDLRKPLTEEQIAVETARCLGCGASVVDYNQCIGCGVSHDEMRVRCNSSEP